MSRKPFIAGNWKMHNTVAESLHLIEEIKKTAKNKNNADILLAPSYTALFPAAVAVKGTNISLAAQDCHYEDKGAFTSAVSPAQVRELCTHVIIGHSERRSVFGDTDEILNNKMRAALKHGLIPVFCIGETLKEREADKTIEVLRAQLSNGLRGLSAAELKDMVIAYEPVWAIGTGKTATPEQAQLAHAFVRGHFEEYGADFAGNLRILYGGSVKTDNIDAIMAQPDVDGVLVGGQSLNAAQFSRIIDFEVK